MFLDIHIIQSKKSFVQTSTVENAIYRLYSDGTVRYQLK